MVLPADELKAEAPHLRELVQETFTGERQKTESAAVDAMNGASPHLVDRAAREGWRLCGT